MDYENDSGMGDAVRAIQAMAARAANLDVITVDTEGLGTGLPDKVPFMYDRGGQNLVDLSPTIEQFRQLPSRRRGVASILSLTSFVDFVNRHKDEHSAVFGNASWPGARIEAVFDYHQLDHKPRHLGHRAVYQFAFSDAFTSWKDADGKPFNQEEFAAFIEDMIADLAAPEDSEKVLEDQFKTKFATPSEMITLSRGLQVNVEAKVKNNVTLQSGEGHLVFEEEHRDSKGDKLIVPGLFMIALPIFEDGEKARIAVRLRYRVHGGSVKWAMQMYKIQEAIVARVRSDLAIVAKGTELPVYEGEPEKSGIRT